MRRVKVGLFYLRAMEHCFAVERCSPVTVSQFSPSLLCLTFRDAFQDGELGFSTMTSSYQFSAQDQTSVLSRVDFIALV